MMRYPIPLLVALTGGTFALIVSACSDPAAPPDGAGGSGGDSTCSPGSPGCGPTGGTGGGGGSPAGGAPSGGEGGVGGFGGIGGFGGFGGIGGAGSCSCDDTAAWSLDCYCAEFECPTLEEILEDPFCASIPSELGESEIVTGCGRITVTLPFGLSARTYVYTEDDHELISAANFDDIGHSSCDTWEYAGGIREFEACATDETEPLCP